MAVRNRASSFVTPIPGGTLGRTDQGLDISASPGSKIVNPVPGQSKFVNTINNWFQGQPLYVFQALTGPFRGRFWYAAEQVRTNIAPGSTVDQGQQIGTYAPSGTATEFGWAANASGETLARATTGYTEGQVTPAGADFASLVRGGRGRAPAGTGHQVWRIRMSQESDGGDGACGPIGNGGMWYSELSTVPMGAASDFAALGNLPCGTVLMFQNPANGKTAQAAKRDKGAGSAFLPDAGSYPALSRALGLFGGVYTVLIWRPDGGLLKPVRGTLVSGAAGAAASPITRPGGGSATPDPAADVGPLFADYEAELDTPRTAPQFSGKNPFGWWWQSFSGTYNKDVNG